MPECTSPINIDTSTKQTCLLKCLYFFKYGNSSARVGNEGYYIRVSYDGASDVLYNGTPYTPTEVRIFKPSIHTYNGQRAEAELIVVHESTSGSDLLVCVPLSSNVASGNDTGGRIIESIIDEAPASGRAVVSVNVSSFNLQHIIPRAKYYSYTGTTPFHSKGHLDASGNEQCAAGSAYHVVFAPADGSVNISSSAMQTLGSLISDESPSLYSYGKCFLNDTGTLDNGFDGDGQIYIDCQPTDSEGEIVYQADDAGSPLSKDDIRKTTSAALDIVKQLGGVFLGVIIFGLCWLAGPRLLFHWKIAGKNKSASGAQRRRSAYHDSGG
jgi:hypothetical protein